MSDPAYPALHIRPATGWVNDPNGLCRVDGTWHVFFQLNRAAPVHGDICWGHVSSRDLLRWTEHPVALSPRPGGPDAAGCWSGCVVDDDGVPTAVYTANPGDPAQATAVLARSDRSLLSWEQGGTVAGVPRVAGVTQVRDPFVFNRAGRRYAVQGAGAPGGRPCLVLHECRDLTAWQELGTLLTDDAALVAEVAPAEIWECPSLVEIDGRWVLVLSLWRAGPDGDVLAGSRWFVGELVADGPGLRYLPTSGGVLDTGPAWYAPQLVTVEGRTLMWGWARETSRPAQEILASGWAGALTFPREVQLRGEQVVMVPARELAGLRAGKLAHGGPGGVPAFEVVSAGRARLLLEGAVVAEVGGTPHEPARILVDGGLVEAFAAGTAHTTTARPGADHAWVVDADPGSTTLHRLALPPPPSH